MSYQAEPAALAPVLNSVPFARTSRALASAAMHMQAQALKAMFHVQIESLAFVQHRCERDLKLIDDLVDSEKYQNTFGVYGEFCRDAVSQYADETRKLIAIGSGIVSEAAKHANEEVDKVFEDVTARTIAL
jgi:Phasin protein